MEYHEGKYAQIGSKPTSDDKTVDLGNVSRPQHLDPIPNFSSVLGCLGSEFLILAHLYLMLHETVSVTYRMNFLPSVQIWTEHISKV